MAGGWIKDGAVQDQIDASVEDAVKKARRTARNVAPKSPKRAAARFLGCVCVSIARAKLTSSGQRTAVITGGAARTAS